MSSYKLKATLRGSKPPIDRTVLVPDDITFEDLASILEIVMCWSGRKECAFKIPRERSLICSRGWNPLDLCPLIDYRGVPLAEFENRSIRFLYGETEMWVLDIKFQKPVDDAPDHPVLKKARGMAPPEDVNGLHGYYRLFGEDSYSEGWAGHEEPMDAVLFDDINRRFSKAWFRSPPVDGKPLDPNTMKVMATALLDPSSHYIFDKQDRKVLPIGDGRGELSEAEADRDKSRYIPLAPPTHGFPFSRASQLRERIRYAGESGDVEAYQRFVMGLKGQDRVDFDTVMFDAGLNELEEWAYDNRFQIDREGFYVRNPEVFARRVEGGVMDILTRAKGANIEHKVRDEVVLCPRCATPCKGWLDRSQTPCSIAGTEVYPMVIVCEKCGRSTTLRYQNDGFNKGFTYPDAQGPASYMEDAVRLYARVASEKDPVRKASLSVDLAGAYWRTRDMDLVRRALGRIPTEKQSRGGLSKLDSEARLRIAALWYHARGEPKEIKQMIRNLKRSVDSMNGPYAALFTACCCRESKGRDECIRMYRRVLEIVGSCEPDDYMAIYSKYLASIHAFQCADDLKDEVVSDMASTARHLADIMESKGFPSDWDFLFSAVFHDTMRMYSKMGSHDGSELSSEMLHRFCSDIFEPHGGLYATIAYASAAFLLRIGKDLERVKELLKDIEDIIVSTADNGPFTVDRSIIAIIVYNALGGERGISSDVAFRTAMSLEMNQNGILDLMELYIRAFAGKKSPESMIEELKGAMIMMDRITMDEIAEDPFDPIMMWNDMIIRPFFSGRAW